MRRLFSILLLVIGGAAHAQNSDLFPEIPKALYELTTPHPDDIRVNHMDYLRHDRDATMYLGDRDTEFSLKDCVDCHAVRGPDASFVTVENDAHFCKSCHVYAAVKIDCFQCHNSVPVAIELTGLYAPDDMSALEAYLEGITE